MTNEEVRMSTKYRAIGLIRVYFIAPAAARIRSCGFDEKEKN
ncbi:hypothetical protein P8625_02385 [Tenacibaculum tangerinum]|uniref:Uncharacterized protein n=1 Tax=Tenacibaculum tangerinum TaxID=3038772 RepID=A0ABY8L5Y6_9FLAO|nr:hypothetical protein [Tenacibaculum tangerinum]WGH76037.1 hypothetical protein P8625_02385 [Tenacibaculum tangerinum]